MSKSMTGISVSSEVVETYQKVKAKQVPWFTMRVSDNKEEVIVDQVGPAGGSSEEHHAALGAVLPDGVCRYAVLDVVCFSENAGREVQKIFFVVWAPDDAKIKDKMMTAATKDAVKTDLEGINFEQQCTDRDEYAWSVFVDICNNTAR